MLTIVFLGANGANGANGKINPIVRDFISSLDPCALLAQVSDQEITTASFDSDSFANIKMPEKPHHEDSWWQVSM
jgi:hypothetical protein